jgi:hypothetical protein
MKVLVDSYPIENDESDRVLATGNIISQSFTGSNIKLHSVKFYLTRRSLANGEIRAELYAHTGVFGTSSKGTGSPLAISNPILAEDIVYFGDIWPDRILYTFTFPSDQQYQMTSGTKYVIGLHYAAGLPPDNNYWVLVGGDIYLPPLHPSTTHPGNETLYYLSGGNWIWGSDNTTDLIFYVYGIEQGNYFLFNTNKIEQYANGVLARTYE